MAHLDLSDTLYQQLRERAQQSRQTLEEFLAATVDERPLAHPEFVSLVTHDLRTPLAAIMTSSDILKLFHDRLSKQERLAHLAIIRMQVKVANDMLDNVMVIQKCTTNSLMLDRAQHDLDILCQTVIDEIDMVTQSSHRITLVNDGGPLVAMLDRALVRLALVNILINAVRFSAHGSSVRVCVVADHPMATIAVTDEGIGIPDDELDRVGDLFYRATNAASIPGRGLGLSVVKDILDLHGGSIALESVLNAGTTVTIRLPMA